MNYIENVFICLAAPFLLAIVCMSRDHRRVMTFLLCGMTACLLSSYISTFLATTQGMDMQFASVNISPIVEEIMKLLPLLFYIVVFEPAKEKAAGALMMIAIGFATFENVCYLTQNGAGHLMFLLIRGFGTGAMHVVCGLIVAIGLRYLWNQRWLSLAGIVGLLAVAVIFHGIYNMMVSQGGAVAIVAYLIPAATLLIVLLVDRGALRNP